MEHDSESERRIARIQWTQIGSDSAWLELLGPPVEFVTISNRRKPISRKLEVSNNVVSNTT